MKPRTVALLYWACTFAGVRTSAGAVPTDRAPFFIGDPVAVIGRGATFDRVRPQEAEVHLGARLPTPVVLKRSTDGTIDFSWTRKSGLTGRYVADGTWTRFSGSYPLASGTITQCVFPEYYAFDASGSFVTSTDNRYLDVVEVLTGRTLASIRGASLKKQGFEFSDDLRYLASWVAGDPVKIWDISVLRLRPGQAQDVVTAPMVIARLRYPPIEEDFDSRVVTADGRTEFRWQDPETLIARDREIGVQTQFVPNYPMRALIESGALFGCFDPHGWAASKDGLLIAEHESSPARVLNIVEGKIVTLLSAPEGTGRCMFSDDNQFVAARNGKDGLLIYRLKTPSAAGK